MRYPEVKDEGKKCLDEFEDDEDCSRTSSTDSDAPDGGWGWLVLLASFCNIVVVDGVCFSYGIIMPEFKRVFKMSNTEAGWLGSTLAGSYLLVGPFVSAMCARYGCRAVTSAGAVVACAGFFISAWCESLATLILFYGVVAGVGFGMIYLPSIVVVGYWFEKKRALATGIALCGSGVGQFLFAPLSSYLLAEYGWDGKMNIIIAGIVLNCAVCGCLFFPLEKHNVLYRRGDETTMEVIEHGSIMKALIEDKKRQRTISNGSLDNCIITRDNRLIKLDPKIFEMKRTNSFIARFKKSLGFSSQSLSNSKNSIQGIPSIVIDAVQKEHNSKMGSPIWRPGGTRVQQLSQTSLQKRGSLPDGSNLPDVTSASAVLCNGAVSSNGAISKGSVNNGMPKTQSCNALPMEDVWLARSLEGDAINGVIGGPPDITRSAIDLQASRQGLPLDGSVISIQVIPNGACHHGESAISLSYSLEGRQRSSNSVGDYSTQMSRSQTTYLTGSVISNPEVQASVEEYERQLAREQSIWWRCWDVLCDMIDLKMLKNPVFAVLVVSSFITLLAFFVPYFYLPEKGLDVGLSEERATFLLSIVGVTNTVGRIIAGWLADRPWMNTLYMNNAALIIAGVSLLMSYECTDPNIIAIVAAMFGLCLAVFNSLRSIMLVDLLGLETLTKSFGLLILFQGIAAIVGAPLAGYIADSTGSVDKSFLVAGSLIVVSGLIMFPIKCLQIAEKGDKPNMMPYAATPLPIQKTLKLPQSAV